MTGSSGPVAVSWQEIESWSRMTRIDVPGYESWLIRELSIEYCNQFAESHRKNVPKPVDADDESKSYRKDVAVAFSRMLKRYAE